jgi:membrane-associated phospholipid phosphatase
MLVQALGRRGGAPEPWRRPGRGATPLVRTGLERAARRGALRRSHRVGTLARALAAIPIVPRRDEPALQRSPVPASIAVPRTRVALGVLMVSVSGFATLTALVRRKRLEAVDLAVTMRLQAVRHPWLERAMALVSWFGFPPQSRLLPPLAAAMLWLGRFRLEAGLQLAAWGSALLSTAIKAFMRRPRPVAGSDLRVVVAELGGSSFPSGHVLTYVTTYGWLALLTNVLVRPPLLRVLLVAPLAALVTAVGPSRIYLGHHWPSDVAGSYFLGAGYLAALLVVYRRLKTRSGS